MKCHFVTLVRKNFFFFVLIIFFFVSCKENKEIENVHIQRFEQALFSANKSKDIDKYLFSIEKEYEPMFATSLQNKEYLDVVKEFIKDKEMNNAYNIVKIQYPDLTKLEQELSFALYEIKKIKKDDLRRSLAMVLQDTHLFTGTVEENIRYGKLDATHEEIVAAAKLSNAHSFIKRLPDGYNTMLTGDGSNLSQGQRQLLAIARAAVADPPVLILDEATSSIDTRTEKLIEKGMDKLMEDKTVFVIAHRLSTVRNSNAIMVLEDGQIIEKGDHDTLLEEKGKYYKLYTGQFELS